MSASPKSYKNPSELDVSGGTPSRLVAIDTNGNLAAPYNVSKITQTHGSVADEASMLLLKAQVGDHCQRADKDALFYLSALPASDANNWKRVPVADSDGLVELSALTLKSEVLKGAKAHMIPALNNDVVDKISVSTLQGAERVLVSMQPGATDTERIDAAVSAATTLKAAGAFPSIVFDEGQSSYTYTGGKISIPDRISVICDKAVKFPATTGTEWGFEIGTPQPNGFDWTTISRFCTYKIHATNTGTIDWSSGHVGCRIWHAYWSKIEIVRIAGFETGFSLAADGTNAESGSAYNLIDVGRIEGCAKDYQYLGIGDGGWVNENTTLRAIFSWASSKNHTTKRNQVIFENWTSLANQAEPADPFIFTANRFLAFTSEGQRPTADSYPIYIQNGSGNLFYDARNENILAGTYINATDAVMYVYRGTGNTVWILHQHYTGTPPKLEEGAYAFGNHVVEVPQANALAYGRRVLDIEDVSRHIRLYDSTTGRYSLPEGMVSYKGNGGLLTTYPYVDPATDTATDIRIRAGYLETTEYVGVEIDTRVCKTFLVDFGDDLLGNIHARPHWNLRFWGTDNAKLNTTQTATACLMDYGLDANTFNKVTDSRWWQNTVTDRVGQRLIRVSDDVKRVAVTVANARISRAVVVALGPNKASGGVIPYGAPRFTTAPVKGYFGAETVHLLNGGAYRLTAGAASKGTWSSGVGNAGDWYKGTTLGAVYELIGLNTANPETDDGTNWTKVSDVQSVQTTVALGGSATLNPVNLAAGGVQTVGTIPVTGAVLGDLVTGISHSVSLGGTRIWGEVTAADTVTVYQQNPTAGSVDVASGTTKVILTRVS